MSAINITRGFLLIEKRTRISRKISQFLLTRLLILVLVDVADPDTHWYPPSRLQLWDIHPGTSVMYTHDLLPSWSQRESYALNYYIPSTCYAGSVSWDTLDLFYVWWKLWENWGGDLSRPSFTKYMKSPFLLYYSHSSFVLGRCEAISSIVPEGKKIF